MRLRGFLLASIGLLVGSTPLVAQTCVGPGCSSGSGTGVTSFNTRTGAVLLEPEDVSGVGGALLSSANVFTAQQMDQGLTGTSPGWYAQITGDAVPRVRVGLDAADVASIAFGSGAGTRDLFLERAGVATSRWGAPDAAAPVAQTQGVQNVLAGTTNTAGALWKFLSSAGTGTGAGGGYEWDVAPAGTTGSTVNAYVSGMTLGTGGLASTLPASLGNVNLTSATCPANGLNLNSTNTVGFCTNGSNRFNISATALTGAAAGSASIGNATASGTVPSIIPNRTSTAYGIGGDGSTKVSLIANSVDVGDIFSYGIADHGAPGASQSALLLDGALLTGGTGTTTFPTELFQPASGVAAASTWNTGGTVIGFNVPSAYTGNCLDAHNNGGGSLWSISCAGSISTLNNLATGNKYTMSGNISGTAWGTGGVAIRQQAGTFTDTTSSGSQATSYIDTIAAHTLAFSNATTVSEADALHISDPVAGTNATLTSKHALGVDSLIAGTSNPFTISTGGIPSSNGIAGVSCAANSVTLLTEVVTNGIVTHC